MASLTSHDVGIRQLGYLVLAQYNDYLESASFKEKAQVKRIVLIFQWFFRVLQFELSYKIHLP